MQLFAIIGYFGGDSGEDHPFPFRTRKLSSPAPMVLHGRLCGRVGAAEISFIALSPT
jgi:hypothetical protein